MFLTKMPTLTATIEKEAFYKYPLNDRILQCISNYFTNSLTLTDSFQNRNGPTLGFLGQTQKDYGPKLWDITLDQIKTSFESSLH